MKDEPRDGGNAQDASAQLFLGCDAREQNTQ